LRFHLVDRITAWYPGERAEGLKGVTRTDGALPRTLLIESLAQLASFLLGDSEAREGRKVLSLLTSVDRLGWQSDLHPGERAKLVATIASRRPEGARVLVEASVDDRPVASGQLGFIFFAAESEQQARDFAWTYELLLGLARDCEAGDPPRREAFV
jgi:3-hydroxymyristoyl/3-hydroxydecanoyl-(acyl carrier protein) dehydratase